MAGDTPGTAPSGPALVEGDAVPDLLVGPGSGATPSRVLSGVDGTELGSGFPFGATFTGGVRVAAADANGDGVTDIIAGMGPGGSLVRVFSGLDATEIVSGYPFGQSFTGGVFVATGDMDGDGRPDVIIGAGAGSGLVRAYTVDADLLFSFAPFGPGYTGGVQVAAGDVDGDGRADLVAAQAAGSLVKVFSAAAQSTLATGFPYGPAFTGGVSVAAGDVDGDGRAEVIVAPAKGSGAVQVYDALSQTVLASLMPYGAALTGGVRVATADFNGDGRAEVIAAPGEGALSLVSIYSGGTLAPYASINVFPAEFAGGVFVAAPTAIGTRFVTADRASFTAGAPGTFTVRAVGAPPVTTITQTGTLPGGIAFTDHGDGTATLAGTPTGPAGDFGLTFTAANGAATPAMQAFTLTVQEAPAITSAAATTFGLGGPGSFTMTTTGFPLPTVSSTGALPAGVTFTPNTDGTATLAGTPAPGTRGVYPLTITATNGIGAAATQEFVLTIDASPAFTSADTATFDLGTPGTFAILTTATPTVTSITSVGTPPPGLSFGDNGNGTATLAGLPTAAGVYTLTLTATNGVGSDAVQTLTVTVREAPAITSANTVSFDLATPGTFDVATSGFPVPEISSAGTLPAGVTFVDNADGTATLSGTPGAATVGDYPLLLTAANGVGTAATQDFTLSVVCPAVSLSPPAGTLPQGTYGTAYSQTFTAIGGSGHTFAVTTGALPAGLTLSGAGALMGSPANSGTFAFTVTATNTAGCDDAAAYILAVSPDAQDESYSNGVGNTQYSVGAGAPSTPAVVVSGSVLSNDLGAMPLTASPASIATTNGGQVAMAANGTFLYTPATGFAGPSDTFTYILTDANSLTDTATVTINLSGVVWYVNGSAGGGGTGRSHQPLDTLTAADTASAANSVVYVHAGSPSGGITLDAGQTLWGAGAAFTLNGLSIASAAKPTLGGTVTIAGDNVTITSVAISTGSSTGVTNAGTRTGLTVTNGVTVATTTGTAVSLSNVESTAGASPTFGINFQSVSSNGAPNAIVLNGVNTAAGSFTVTGTGSAGSGGIVQNTTGDSVRLTNAQNVSLSSMVVQNSQESGLLGANVTGLTLADCTFTNNGDDSEDVGIYVTNLWGTSAFDNVSVTGSALANVFIDNDGGTLTSLAISGTSSFSNLGTEFGGNSMLVQMRGAAVMTAGSIVGAAFADNGLARGLTVQSQEAATISDFLVQGNTFTDNGLHTSFEQSGTANLTFRLVNNSPMTGSAPLQAVNVFSSSISTGGTIRGRIQGNTIGNASADGSGSTTGQGIRVLVQGATGATLLVDGNTIRETPNGRGIDMQFLGPLAASPGVTHDVTVTNNDVDHINLPYQPGSSDFPLAGIYVAADSQGAAPVTVRANISGNTVLSTEAFDVFDAHLIFNKVVVAGTCQLVGGAADATVQLTGTNTGSAQAAAGCTLIPGPIVTPP